MKNLSLKILAILSAIVFWVIIINLENTFYVLPEPIEIQAFNLPENLAVQQELGNATLTLNVAPTEVKKISPKDFNVYVDLKNAGAGERQAEVSVSSKNPEVRILKVEPSIIKFTLEEIKEKKVPVTYVIKGNPAENYQVKEVTLGQDEITVKGSKDSLAKVSEVQAAIILQGTETETFNQKAILQATDTKGKIIKDLSLELTELSAGIVIEQGLRSKTVGIEPVITGELESAWLRSLRIHPTNVRIKGNNNEISGITNIKTNPIDIRKLQEKKTITIGLQLPKGIKLDEGASKVITISADIKKITPPPTIENEEDANSGKPDESSVKVEEPKTDSAFETKENN